MDISLYVNPVNVALCMAIGKIIKSSRFCKKIPNDLIPYILVLCGVIFEFVVDGFRGLDSATIANTLACGIISSAAAVGLHQGGKKLFIDKEVDSVDEHLLKAITETEETSDDENVG